MATPSPHTQTYAGEFAGEYISAALLSGKTLREQAISIKQNIKKSETIKTIDLGGLIGASQCDFTDAGTIGIGERVITPEEFQVNLELCKKDYRNDWDALAMRLNQWF